MRDSVTEAREILKSSDALLIGTGAGMGVDSGLPDFRGREGFWRAYPHIAKLGLAFEEMANPFWFESDPALAWAFYGHRLNLYRSVVPHGGFGLLLECGKQKPYGCFAYTSNVDGHFQKAGFHPDQIVECHGSIHHLQCTQPCSDDLWSAEGTAVIVEDESTFRAKEPLPKCRACSRLARPNVLMFGDACWVPDRSREQEQRMEAWLNHLRQRAAKLAIVEIGAGTAIQTVRYRMQVVAARFRCRVIRINPADESDKDGSIHIGLGALDGLHQLLGD